MQERKYELILEIIANTPFAV